MIANVVYIDNDDVFNVLRVAHESFHRTYPTACYNISSAYPQNNFDFLHLRICAYDQSAKDIVLNPYGLSGPPNRMSLV